MATILQKGNEVFYNPAQVVNRDLSVAVLSYFSEQRAAELAANGASKKRSTRGGVPYTNTHRNGLNILEGLAASGLRSIRYAKEIDGVEIISNIKYCGIEYEISEIQGDMNDEYFLLLEV